MNPTLEDAQNMFNSIQGDLPTATWKTSVDGTVSNAVTTTSNDCRLLLYRFEQEEGDPFYAGIVTRACCIVKVPDELAKTWWKGFVEPEDGDVDA